MVGGLLWLATRTEELAEAHVTIGELRVVIEQTLAEALRLIELTGVNQVDDAVGELVDRMAVVGHGEPRNAGHRRWWWSVSALLVAGGALGGLVFGQTALLVFLATAAGTGLVASDLGHGSEMSLLKLFSDATFYHVLERIDAELAEAARRARCPRCGGVLHKASYPRKPRGGPADLPACYGIRASYCCAVEGCRARVTPPSVRFLGRHVYLGAVVVLASALQHGVGAFRVRQLTELFGASRQTLLRWRSWWLEAFAASRFWQSLRGLLVPAVDETTLPRSLVERFERGPGEGGPLAALLGVLQPISTRPWLSAGAS